MAQAPAPKFGRAFLLLLATTLTTTTLGSLWLQLIRTDYVVSTSLLGPALTPSVVLQVWSDPALLLLGLKFSIPALTILLAHELGHVLACRHYGLWATPPYFLPAPFGFGTLGAFIKIRSPIRSRQELFDVGASGPLAGFVVLLPFLLYGIAQSEPVALEPASPIDPSALLLYVPGDSLGFHWVSELFHGPLGDRAQLNLHPFALAAWLGMLATAINLLPFGQLDGGHIFYAATGRWQHRLAWPLWLAMAVFGLWTRSWLLWCVLTLFLGIRHPRLADERPLGQGRKLVAFLTLLMLFFCFSPVPLEEKFVSPASLPEDLRPKALPAPRAQDRAQSLHADRGFASSTKVTGPSLTSSTSISARNLPVSTR